MFRIDVNAGQIPLRGGDEDAAGSWQARTGGFPGAGCGRRPRSPDRAPLDVDSAGFPTKPEPKKGVLLIFRGGEGPLDWLPLPGNLYGLDETEMHPWRMVLPHAEGD